MARGEMGRPKGKPKERRYDRITIPLNAEELAQIEAANEASGLGLPAATFCRMILLKATEKSKK
jgi:hypothetical protein